MIKMSNGIETIEIPEGAAKIYKNMGFVVVDGKDEDLTSDDVYEEQMQSNVSEDSGDEKPVDDGFEDLLSKPISQWNQEEVKEFAAAKGIDVSSAKSLKHARAIIKEAIEEQEKSFMGE